MGLAWLAATVWAHSTGRDGGGYALGAVLFGFVDAVLIGIWIAP